MQMVSSLIMRKQQKRSSLPDVDAADRVVKKGPLVQSTFMQCELEDIKSYVGNITDDRIAAELKRRWDVRLQTCLEEFQPDSYMKLEVTVDTEEIHADMIKDGWCLIAQDTSYKYYANQKKKRSDSAVPNAAECRKEAVPELEKSGAEESVQDVTSSSVEKSPAVANDDTSEAVESVATAGVRERLTEWMIRNGSTEAMAKMLNISPEESAIVDNPRVLASRLAYSVFPPTSDIGSADLLTPGERPSVQSDEESSPLFDEKKSDASLLLELSSTSSAPVSAASGGAGETDKKEDEGATASSTIKQRLTDVPGDICQVCDTHILENSIYVRDGEVMMSCTKCSTKKVHRQCWLNVCQVAMADEYVCKCCLE